MSGGLFGLLDDVVEKATKEIDAVAVTDLGQAGVIRQWLMQVIAEIPSQTEAVGGDDHELAFRADALEKHDELELEKHDRVDGRSSASSIAGLN